MGEAATASAASLHRPRPPHRGTVGSCPPGTAAVGLANGEKVCTGFAELSPARGSRGASWRHPAPLILPLRQQRPICAPRATATGSRGASAGPFPPAAPRCHRSFLAGRVALSGLRQGTQKPGARAGRPLSLWWQRAAGLHMPLQALPLPERWGCSAPPASWAEGPISQPGGAAWTSVAEGSSDSREASGSGGTNLRVPVSACGRPGSGWVLFKTWERQRVTGLAQVA